MGPQCANGDLVVAEMAARQHGVVRVGQLREAGIGPDATKRRVAAGRLHRIHRGVYAVGHPGLSREGLWIGAVLACGEGAALSHRSAAELWGLLPRRAGPVHVTVRTPNGRRRRPGLRIHRTPWLTEDETTCREGIAVTVPARTLHDLERTAPPWLVRRATRQAEYLGLDLGGIATDGTRSDLERAFLLLCRRHRLPVPEVNVTIGRYTVDFLWRRGRLIVETDGYAAHRGRQAFEDDRARELYLHDRGYRVRRFSDRQIGGRAGEVAHAIRAELGR